MKYLLLPLLFALVLSSSAHAQSTTPESIALELSEAYKELDFDRAADMMHPDALQGLKEMVMDIMSFDSTGSIAILFTGETDPEAIQNMHPKTAFSRFMEGLLQIQPEMAQAFTSLETETLGHIMEGESIAHVVTRGKLSVMGIDMEQMEVMTLKRHEDTWLALLSGDISNMAQAFKSNMLR